MQSMMLMAGQYLLLLLLQLLLLIIVICDISAAACKAAIDRLGVVCNSISLLNYFNLIFRFLFSKVGNELSQAALMAVAGLFSYFVLTLKYVKIK